MTTKNIIALLVAKIDLTGAFTSVVDASDWPRAEKQTPQAIVGFSRDDNTGNRSRLISNETYEVIVVTNKANESEDIWELIDLVRDTIHGKDWGNVDIDAFQWESRSQIDADPGTIAYSLMFSVINKLHIPTLS